MRGAYGWSAQCKIHKVSKQINVFLERLESNCQFIIAKRNGVEYVPRDMVKKGPFHSMPLYAGVPPQWLTLTLPGSTAGLDPLHTFEGGAVSPLARIMASIADLPVGEDLVENAPAKGGKKDKERGGDRDQSEDGDEDAADGDDNDEDEDADADAPKKRKSGAKEDQTAAAKKSKKARAAPQEDAEEDDEDAGMADDGQDEAGDVVEDFVLSDDDADADDGDVDAQGGDSDEEDE